MQLFRRFVQSIKTEKTAFAIQFLNLILISMAIFPLYSNSNRGFDASDEGYNLLRYRFPYDLGIAPHTEHLYLGPLFRWLHYDIVVFRIFGISLLLASAVFFALSFVRFIRSRYGPFSPAESLSVFSVLFSSSLLFYVWFILTPNYNWFTAVGCTLSLGFLLSSPLSEKKQHLFEFASGLMLGLVFFCKFSAALSFFAAGICFLFFVRKNSKNLGYSVTSYLCGLTLLMLFQDLLIQSSLDYIENFRASLHYLNLLQSGHRLSLLTAGLLDLQELIRRSSEYFKDVWIWVGGLGLFHLVWTLLISRRKTHWLDFLFLFTPLPLLAYLTLKGRYHLGGSLQIWTVSEVYTALFILFFLQLIILSLANVSKLKKDSFFQFLKAAFLFLFFLALPYFYAVGTARAIYLNTIFFMHSWFAALMILWIGIRYFSGSQWVLPVFSLATTLLISSQVMTSSSQPMRLLRGMQWQTEEIEIGTPPTRLAVDSETYSFFSKLKDLANQGGLTPEKDLFTFFDQPGLNYVLGAKSPGLAWYSYGYKGSVQANLFALGKVDRTRLQQVFILELAQDFRQIPELKQLGLDFPGAYQLIGDATWSELNPLHFRLWKPRIESGN